MSFGQATQSPIVMSFSPGMIPMGTISTRSGLIARDPIYAQGVQFSRRWRNVPGQPYQSHFSDEQIRKRLYSEIDVAKKAPPAEGTNPVKLVKTKTGLEVPAYLLKRDIERKKENEIEAQIERIQPPPFARVGEYAAANPGKASLMALLIGALIANTLG